MTSVYHFARINVASRKEGPYTLLFLASFLTFGGYYVILTLSSNGIINIPSRYTSVFVRILIVNFILIYYIKYSRANSPVATKLFLIFSALYIVRILIELSSNTSSYSISPMEFALYFLSFTMMPAYLISKIRFTEKMYDRIFISIVISCIALSLSTIIFYSKYILSGYRITKFVKLDDNYISPLALSYTASLGCGICISYLITNHTSKYRKLLLSCGALISIIPFFLGASRGSLIAFSIPMAVLALSLKGVKLRLLLILSAFVGSIILYIATIYLGDTVFTRFLSIKSDIDSGSSSAIRAMVWADSLRQFLDNPIFGSSLEADITHHHPHNIFLEILISTGVLGFTPFLIFIIICLYKSFHVARNMPNMFWIPVIFLQGFSQNMFSGAIYGASWLAFGAGLLLSLEGYRLTRKRTLG